MDTAQLRRFCGRLPGAARRRYAPPENVLVYSIGGRWFAYFKTSLPERWRFSVRVTPQQFLDLTDVPGIKPARYRARAHWVTVVHVEQLPADYLKQLVRDSYLRALRALPRRQHAEILASHGATRLGPAPGSIPPDAPLR